MWLVIKSILPAGRTWYAVAAGSFLALLLGVYLGVHWQSVATARVQHSLDVYKLEVAESLLQGNQQVVDDMKTLTRNLSKLESALQQARVKDQAFSTSLIKDLQDANGKSCPLSPAVVKYLDGLRASKTARPN